MAVKTWIGVAPARQQYDRVQFTGTKTGGDKVSLVVNGRVGPQVVLVTGAVNSVDIANQLAAACPNGGPVFTELGYAVDSTTGDLLVTGPADGKPITLTAVSSGGGFTYTVTNSITGTGPSHWDNAANWSGGTVPVAADDLVFSGGAAPKYGLPGSGTAFGTVTFRPESAGAGLPEVNPAGYVEYLTPRRLVLNHTGTFLVQTAALTRIDAQPAAARVFTVNTPATTTGGLDLVTNAFNHVLSVLSGRVVVADGQGETAQFGTLTMSNSSAVTVTVGSGVTLTTLSKNGGTCVLKCAATTVSNRAGYLNRTGSGAVSNWNNSGGTAEDYGTGAITTLNAEGSYTYYGAGATVSTLVARPFCVVTDASGKLQVATLTMTDVHLPGPPGNPGPAPVYLNFGTGRVITVGPVLT